MGGQMEMRALLSVQHEYRGFNHVILLVKEITTELFECKSGILYSNRHLNKPENTFMDYQIPKRRIERPVHLDRVFPLETVEIKGFGQKYDYDIQNAVIHTGSYADELAASYNAMAVTIATNMFFRDNAYNPATEEGRALLSHELTHVAQHEEGRIDSAVSEKKLEAEAEYVEKQELYNPDPLVTVKICGKLYTFRKSQMEELAAKVADNVEQWIQTQKALLSEEKYLKLLCNYLDWLERGKYGYKNIF
jgi:hypothetical protein